MCLIILKDFEQPLKYEWLEEGWSSNPHGAGIMFPKNKRLVVIKGLMSFEDFIKEYEAHKQEKMGIHFRWSTHGSRDEKNTHPFLVDTKLAFMHNGVIDKLPTIEAGFSDTWHMNEYVLKKLPKAFWNNKAVLRLIADYVSTDKLLFMNNLGETLIINQRLGTVEDNVWFSNSSYKRFSRSHSRFYMRTTSWDEHNNYCE